MRDAEPTERELALQAVVDRLECRIEILEAAMGMGFLPPIEWGLTSSEARVFGALLERELVTIDVAMAVLYRDNAAEEAEEKILDVFICKIRKKLKPFGIEILTRWGVGYQLSGETKKAVRTMCAVDAVAA